MLKIFVDKEHKLKRSLTLFVWGPIQTLIGFVLLYFATSFAFGFLNWILETKYLVHNNITVGAVFFFSIAYFYLMAMAKVKEAYVGQPTLLGARRKGFVLPEGYSLILPWPIMGYSEIPIQPTTTELKEPMEILVSNQPEKDNDNAQPLPSPVKKDPNQPLPYQVRMKISMSIMWEVEPQEILNYTAIEGGKVGVEKALVEVMRRSIRERAQHLTDTQVLTGQEAFEVEVRKALNTKFEDESEMSLVKRLGIKIIKVQTTKIVPSSEELTQRYERLRGEDLDRQAETNQANHLADNLIEKFKSKDVSSDLAFLGALAMTKDAKLVGVVGNAGDFTKGQVAASEGGK